MSMKSQKLKFRNRLINVYTKGVFNKRTLVFIHGNSLSAKTFSEQFKSIETVSLLAIDLPGHGLSEAPSVPNKIYNILGYIDIIKFVLAELNVNDFILIGHSLGGHIALEASGNLFGLKGLLIFGTPPLGMPPEFDKAFIPNAAMPLLFQEILSDKEMELLAANLTDEINKEEIIIEMRLADGNARSFLGASIPKGLFKNELEIVEKLNVPVAIIHGEYDALINLEYLNQLSAPTLWKNKIHLISSATHCPQIEQALAFNSILTEFSDEII